MKSKLVTVFTALMFAAVGASALETSVGFGGSLGWGDVTADGTNYPFTVNFSLTNGAETGSFDLVVDAAPSGSTVNFAGGPRLGISSSTNDSGAIESGEVLYLTFTNISASITNLLFAEVNTYQLNDTVNDTNLVVNESITLYDGDLNSQVMVGADNQSGNTVSNLLQSVSEGETFYIETASNSTWYVNRLIFDVGLPFTLPPSSALVVDFTDDGTRDSGGIMRAADVGNGGTDTNAVWNFSDETAGTPQYIADGNDEVGDQNQSFYGGLIKTITGNTFSILGNNQDGSLINGSFRNRYFDGSTPSNTAVAFKGAYVWSKEEFLVNSTEQLQLSDGDSISLNTTGSGGDQQIVRMVVRQGGTYYASSSSAQGGLTIDDFAAETWGVLNTNDYSVEAFGPLSITDLEAVGFTFDYNATATAGNNLIAQLNWDDFQVIASVVQPTDPTVGPLSIEPLGTTNVVISWSAGAAGTHTLQTRPDLVFGMWSNMVDIVPGVETTLSVTTTATEAESFYRVSAE